MLWLLDICLLWGYQNAPELLEKLTKSPLKLFKMKFLAMHITNKKNSFAIFKVGNLQNIFMEHDLYLIS